MGFGAQLGRFEAKANQRRHDVFVVASVMVHQSVKFGSPITGAPGQPVDEGYLKNSISIGWDRMPSFPGTGEGADKDPAGLTPQAEEVAPADATRSITATNVVYADSIEKGVGRFGTLSLRSEEGGFHSFDLTIAGWKSIVREARRIVVGSGA